MPRLFPVLSALCCLALVAAMGCSSGTPGEAHSDNPRAKPRTLTFNGGPRGGTFNHFANKMAAVISEDVPNLDVRARQSGGSVSNLLALCAGKADMAIVNAGDAFLGRTGKLRCLDKKYADIQAMAFLYWAPAQLVIRADSKIHTVLDLRGKVIAVGNPGSGAALSAERFFRHLKLWTRFEHLPEGYAEAAADFAAGKVDGFWTLAGAPTTAVIEAAAAVPVRLMDLHEAATISGFYQLYPFYSRATIPAGTYPGQTEPVDTFQDAALWCVRPGLDNKTVYDSLQAVFSAKRLKEMRRIHGAAGSMGPETGIDNLSIPLHPGAVHFWSEHRLEIPPILMP
ncbi:TAXI family TRAP transporter solute-binding subunit [Pseudodesulfovibrio methanolicus]|uniref:TAXI family TRAP transporter solute-binding subunit n=1 Tax=Pseudodesulfovibrio methanolicus TaxID=3126690 RepID=A0ABZ2IVR3_9BACT